MKIEFTVPGVCVPKGRGRAFVPGKRYLEEKDAMVLQKALKAFTGGLKTASMNESKTLKVATSPDQIDRMKGMIDNLWRDAERSYRSPVVHTPDTTDKFEKSVGLIAQSAMRRAGYSKPFECPVRFELVVYRKIPKSTSKSMAFRMCSGAERPAMTPDYDNLQKSISDAMNHIVFADDRQIVDAVVSKRWDDGKGERFVVIVTTETQGEYQWIDKPNTVC